MAGFGQHEVAGLPGISGRFARNAI